MSACSTVATLKLVEAEKAAFLKLCAWLFPIKLEAERPSSNQLEGICDTTILHKGVLAHQLKEQTLFSEGFETCFKDLENVAASIDNAYQNDVLLLLIDGFPVNAASFRGPDMAAAIGLLCKNRLLEYQDFGTLVDAIRDENAGGVGTSKNSGFFALHTDLSPHPYPPSYMLMLMERNAEIGGDSLFCDMREVLQKLPCEAAKVLQQDFEFLPLPGKEGNPLLAPILNLDEHQQFKAIRYRRDRINETRLNEAQFSALKELDMFIQKNLFKIKLAAGSAVLVFNRQMLHGREAFQGKDRLAWRVYVQP